MHPPRLGPRPLPLHLGTALMTWASCESAWRLWKSGSPSSKPDSALPDSLAALLPEVAALEAAKPAHVISVGLFDVYRGAGLTDGRKSLAILVLMQDTSRTLTDVDIEATADLMVSVAREKFGATLRQ